MHVNRNTARRGTFSRRNTFSPHPVSLAFGRQTNADAVCHREAMRFFHCLTLPGSRPAIMLRPGPRRRREARDKFGNVGGDHFARPRPGPTIGALASRAPVRNARSASDFFRARDAHGILPRRRAARRSWHRPIRHPRNTISNSLAMKSPAAIRAPGAHLPASSLTGRRPEI